MNVHDYYFNSQRGHSAPKKPYLRQRHSASLMLSLFIANVVRNVIQGIEEMPWALGSCRIYLISRMFYSHEPHMPQDSSDAAITLCSLFLSIKILKFQVSQTWSKYNINLYKCVTTYIYTYIQDSHIWKVLNIDNIYEYLRDNI